MGIAGSLEIKRLGRKAGYSPPSSVEVKNGGIYISTSPSEPLNTRILQSFQSKTLRMITGAPWYVSNQTLHEDLKMPLIQDIIKSNITKYKDRTTAYENRLIKDLFTQTLEERRLKRIWPEDLLDDV
jgi:hypothetical protein